MANLERKTVREEICSIYIETDAKSLIEELQGYIAKYGDSVYLDKQYYQYENGEYIAAFYERPETDEEMAKRIAQETETREMYEARDRAAYERLKAKYG